MSTKSSKDDKIVKRRQNRQKSNKTVTSKTNRTILVSQESNYGRLMTFAYRSNILWSIAPKPKTPFLPSFFRFLWNGVSKGPSAIFKWKYGCKVVLSVLFCTSTDIIFAQKSKLFALRSPSFFALGRVRDHAAPTSINYIVDVFFSLVL